jgi:RNA polymerase sigma-70 factor (ECF subfamily)
MEARPDPYSTRASLFMRLGATDVQPREIAWGEFRTRYAPVIAGFARNMGVPPQDVDDVIQDVLLGFFSHAPTFVYDPAKGRFRGYLKVCTFRAMKKRLGQNARFKSVPLQHVPEDDLELDQTWNDVWAEELLNRAITAVRKDHGERNAFRAFELSVLGGQRAEEVARSLGISVNTVYKAKERILKAVRLKVQEISNEEG